MRKRVGVLEVIKKWLLVAILFVCPHLLFAFCAPHAIGASPEEDPSHAKGQRWAFCIGVGRFKDPRITELPQSRNDAKGLARILHEHGGFDHLFLFMDDLPGQDPFFPSARNIKGTLEEAMKRVKPEDVMVICYSGHGGTDPSGRDYLLTVDTMLQDLPGTAIPLDFLFHLVKKSGVKRSILFLDASREEVMKGKGSSLGGIYPDRYLRLRDGVGAVFYGARKGTFSHDDDASEYGVFAKSLIAGLGGEADLNFGGNHDGRISLRELAGYVQEAISNWSLKTRKRQIPDMAILDRDLEEMMISSVQERRTGTQVPVAAAAEKGPPPEIKEMEKRKDDEIPIETKSAEKEVSPEPVKEEKSQKTIRKEAEPAQIQQRPEEAKEEIQKEVKVEPPAPTVERIMQQEEARKTEEEKTVIAKERPPDKEVAQEEKIIEKPKIEVGSIREAALKKEVTRREPVSFRNRPADLGPKDIKAILMRYHFYATCWIYNDDFCNPDGDFENDLVDNHDGTILDRATGLMWQKSSFPQEMTWSEAIDYAKRINMEGFKGYSDWRIPTVVELASLMESAWKNGDLFMDPLFDSRHRDFWSADTLGTNKAWRANFHLGFFLDYPHTAPSHVRLVRSVQ